MSDAVPTAKTKRRREVERIEDWDDARYSHVPPRAAADERLTLVHLRVLVLIGKVNTQHGWCQLSQTTAADLFGIRRPTVNAAISDLVEWGYVERRTQAETKTSFCHYRVLIDEPDEGDPEEGGVSATDDTPPGGECQPQLTRVSATADTGVSPEGTPPMYRARAREIRDQRSLPQPHGASATGLEDQSDLIGKAARLLAGLSHVRAEVVEHLFRPILERRRFSAADKRAELERLGRSANSLPVPALQRAADIVLGSDVQTVKPQRIADAIDKVRAAGAMIPIKPGTPQWQRWLEHFETVDPRQASVMVRTGVWQVPSEWPPAAAKSEPSRGAA